MIERLAECDLNTHYGQFHEYLYYDGRKETIAMVLGELEGASEVLCRLHSSCLHGHAFNSLECSCREEMARSQELIQESGRGIIIWMDQEGKGNGHYALLKSIAYKRKGLTQAEAYEAAGFDKDARDFKAAAEILNDLGVVSVQLLTSNPAKVEFLERYKINVTGIKKIS